MDVAVPKTFRKRPVEIKAVQLGGSLGSLVRAANWAESEGAQIRVGDGVMFIDTLEGTMEAREGWWLIQGVKGEFYACEPEIFGLSYEEVDAI